MKKIVKEIIQFNEERDWRQFHQPKNLAISLVLESTEILELFQWTADGKLPEDRAIEMKEELADAYYWLLLLAHDMDVDLNKELRKKMKKNAAKYPVEKSRGRSTKYNRLK